MEATESSSAVPSLPQSDKERRGEHPGINRDNGAKMKIWERRLRRILRESVRLAGGKNALIEESVKEVGNLVRKFVSQLLAKAALNSVQRRKIWISCVRTKGCYKMRGHRSKCKVQQYNGFENFTKNHAQTSAFKSDDVLIAFEDVVTALRQTGFAKLWPPEGQLEAVNSTRTGSNVTPIPLAEPIAVPIISTTPFTSLPRSQYGPSTLTSSSNEKKL